MLNRKIKFNSESCPRSPICNVGFLDRWILVKNRLAAYLVGAAVEVTANVRQNRAFQVFIFQKECAPSVVRAVIGQIVTKCVRIVEAVVRVLIEWWIRIGRPFFVGRQRQRTLPYPDLGRG